MSRLVAGIFRDLETASAAVERLHAAGVPTTDISVVARDTSSAGSLRSQCSVLGARCSVLTHKAAPGKAVCRRPREQRSTNNQQPPSGAVVGGIGGLLAGPAALTIPGFGPILVLGPIAGALGGAAIGAAAGGLVGGLVGLGLPEEYASRYVVDLERGGVLIAARSPGTDGEAAEEVMRRAGAANLYSTRTVTPA